MNQAYVLGLDLGTSSIGIAALTLNIHKQPESILDHYVYLFKEPVVNEQGTLVSKKASRRANRQARKQRDRRNGRHRDLAALCYRSFKTNSNSPSYLDSICLDIKQFQSLALRAHAAQHQIKLSDMTAVIMHVSKSRGYSSGFKPLSKSKQDKLATAPNIDERIELVTGEVQPGHMRLEYIMAQRHCQTVGQYLLDRAKRGLPSILKSSDRIYVPTINQAIEGEIEIITDKKTGEEIERHYYNLYALRDEIEHEFKTIWNTQAQYHPELTPELFEQFNTILFYQRPLKSVMHMVGGCMVEPNLPRASRAHPAFQVFRIEKQLADLRWGYGRNAKHLTTEELSLIRQALHNPGQLDSDAELSFEKIYKLLESVRDTNASHNLNLAKGGRDGLKGNVTNKRWNDLKLFDAWQKLAEPQTGDQPHLDRQTWVINFLSDLGSIDSLYPDHWYEQFYLPDLPAKNGQPARQRRQAAMFKDSLFIDFINQFRVHEKYNRLSSLAFDSGRTSYSIKALNKINRWLHEQIDLSDDRVDEHQAIKALYEQSRIEQKVLNYLDNPAKVGNGVVDVALMQVKKVVNHFIAKHGKPARIVIEMTREMSKGLTLRNEIQKQQQKNNKIHKLAAQDMLENNEPYSRTNVLRYRLAQEQGYICPYCGKKLGAREIYVGSLTNIEHIVPQSITQVRRKFSEITLAHAHCNQKKGKLVPMEAFSFDTAPIEAMAKRLRSMGQERKALLLEMPETPINKLDDNILNEFCDRQFHETAWITKLTATWLRSLGINVECTQGQLTAQLRGQWQLESIIPEVRLTESLPIYSTNTLNGEIKETIIPSEAMYDAEGNRTLLWKYWDQQRLTPDEFAELRQTGLYRYDKRCDHRHHLIDAITIALCDRSTVKHMADEYRKRSEQEEQKAPKLRKNIRLGRIAPPIPRLREQVREAVKAQHVTHRPDRRVSGAWFQETAYGLFTDKDQSNQQFLTNRINIRGLIGKDDAATIANIAGIIGEEVRKTLKDSYDTFKQMHWGNGSAKDNKEYETVTEQLWLTPPLHQRLQRPIVKVRQKKASYLASKHVIIKHNNPLKHQKPHHKVLITDENAFIAWNPENPADGYIVINNYAARNANSVQKHWKRVHKGDTLKVKNELYVVKGLNEANNRIETMRAMCATSSLKTSKAEGRQDFSLTPAKRTGSMSLWDIAEIIEDPFHGRPTRTDD